MRINKYRMTESDQYIKNYKANQQIYIYKNDLPFNNNERCHKTQNR